MNNKISCVYLASISSNATGGTEVLHQLAYKLRAMNFSVKMFYYNGLLNPQQTNVVAERLANYGIEFTFNPTDSENDVIIIPEVAPFLVHLFKKAHCILWWLSIDNYFVMQRFNTTRVFKKAMIKSMLKGNLKSALLYRSLKTFDPFIDNKRKVDHWVQSAYARATLIKNGIEKDRISYLSDYLNKDFILNSGDNVIEGREDVVLYNPKKGRAISEKLIELSPQIKYVPLQNLSSKEIAALMMRSKVYIDFGNHPGKDRIPREAAICGCVVITNRRGSAAFFEDVPIDETYKIEEKHDFELEVISLIEDVFTNFDKHYKNFDQYRAKIKEEEIEFENQVADIFKKIGHKG